MGVPNPAAQVLATSREFRQFLLKNNVLALALGVIIGAAMGEVVKSIVDDLIGGVIGALNVNRDAWSALNFKIWRFDFKFGNFASVVFKFLIVAAVVFGITKLFIKQAAPPPTKTCPECLEGIHPEAARCKFCTAVQPKPTPAAG